ncbi:MAG: T9SS type A sorting domain-containing protein [Calditrichaeota bacterium]|nr:T9SS type A sorting domain-containing protein [Calditrichota bacterium]
MPTTKSPIARILLSAFVSFSVITTNSSAASALNHDTSVQLISDEPASARLQVNFGAPPRVEILSLTAESEPPIQICWVLIPPDCGVDVKLNNHTTQTVRRSDTPVFQRDLPFEFVRLGAPAVMRGYRLAPLLISPMRFNLETQEIEWLTSAEVELDFTSSANRTNLVSDPAKPRPSRYIRKLLEQMVVNPPALHRDDDMIGGSIVYVTPNYNDVNNALAPLVEWRRRMGWKVEVLRIAQNTDRFVIQNALREAYNEWEIPPEFIVLVGDAPGMMGNNRTLAYYDIANGARYPYESDQPYALLEGNDYLPEAAIGRITFDNIEMLNTQVNKIIQYESTPYIGQNNDRNWQLKAAVAATDSRSGRSSIDVCEWFGELVRQNGFVTVNELYYSAQDQQVDPTNFLSTNINAGLSFVLYRGWSDLNGFRVRDIQRQIRNGQKLPFIMLATCNTGEYVTGSQDSPYGYTERFVNLSVGAIGAVGAAGATHSAYNNLIASATLRAPFVDKVYAQGWALQMGKLALVKAYEGRGDINHEENSNMQAWLTLYYIYNLMGDPAVELYTAVPRRLAVSRPDQMRQGETHYSVQVRYADDNRPAAEANVCLYKAQGFQLMQRADQNGRVDFVLQPEWTQSGQIKFTISGPNLIPILADLNIAQALVMFGIEQIVIDDDDEGASSGDDDGEAEPLETLELSLRIKNCGTTRPNGNMTAVLRSVSSLLTVENDTLVFNVAPGPGVRQEAVYQIVVGGGCPNGMEAKFILEVIAGGQSYVNSFSFPIYAPQLEFANLEWAGEPLRPGRAEALSIWLTNIGADAAPDVGAELISFTPTITVPFARSSFAGIDIRQRGMSDRGLWLEADIRHIAGNNADLALILQAQNGFCDTAFFSLPIGRAQADQPFGPDKYGYICIDDIDLTWENRPSFEWIELNPRLGGRGTNTGLTDFGEERDASCVVRLPFTFRYYGRDFDSLTICTNGWAAFGNHSALVSARNRQIPGGEVVSAMLCPFWDDLLTTVNNGVFYWYDRDNRVFVVEWCQMRKLGQQGNGEPLETFEIILYDPAVHRTATGDGEIVFQYQDIIDTRSCFQQWDTPFATVGIGSPDQSDGLQYTYWGALHPGATDLVDNRAIKFTTERSTAVGFVRGIVSDAMTGEPLSNARVRLSLGNQTTTNESGEFFFANLPVSRDVSATVDCLFYNDSTRGGLEIIANDTIEANFALLKPLFSLDRELFEIRLSQVQIVADSFLIRNSGSGSLTFSSQLTAPGVKWLTWTPHIGMLNAGDSLFIRLDFDPTELTEGIYTTNIQFTHNARPGFGLLPIRLSVALATPNEGDNQPLTFAVESNYPNPFNARTTLNYSLPVDGEVILTVVDIHSRVQVVVHQGYKLAGRHKIEFDGGALPAGVYFGRLEAGNLTKTVKLLLVK